MTIRQGRNGKKFFRAQQDPQLDWATGVGASAGYRPEGGVAFAQTKPGTKLGLKLSRQGAQKTRGANAMVRQQPTVSPMSCPPGHLKDHKTGQCVPISCPDGDPFCYRQEQDPTLRSEYGPQPRPPAGPQPRPRPYKPAPRAGTPTTRAGRKRTKARSIKRR